MDFKTYMQTLADEYAMSEKGYNQVAAGVNKMMAHLNDLDYAETTPRGLLLTRLKNGLRLSLHHQERMLTLREDLASLAQLAGLPNYQTHFIPAVVQVKNNIEMIKQAMTTIHQHDT